MKQTIIYCVLAICFIMMMYGIIVYYQTSIGKLIVGVSALIAFITCLFSDDFKLEDEDEEA